MEKRYQKRKRYNKSTYTSHTAHWLPSISIFQPQMSNMTHLPGSTLISSQAIPLDQDLPTRAGRARPSRNEALWDHPLGIDKYAGSLGAVALAEAEQLPSRKAKQNSLSDPFIVRVALMSPPGVGGRGDNQIKGVKGLRGFKGIKGKATAAGS